MARPDPTLSFRPLASPERRTRRILRMVNLRLLPVLAFAASLVLPLPAVPARALPARAVPAGVTTATTLTAVPAVTKILTIIEENHSQASALATMPYLRSIGERYGRTTNYLAVSHPSLPNYLALAGGSTFGVTDDRGPSAHPLPGQTVLDQALAHGRPAKTYAEGMPSPCYRGYTSTSPRYAVRHNPWTYFTDATSRKNCGRYDVPLGTTTAGTLAADIGRGTLPTVGLVIPDTCHDGHDRGCTAEADAWLQSWVQKIHTGPDWLSGRLAIVVTFDEDDSSSGNVVLTTIDARYLPHTVADGALTHYSWTRWADELAGSYLLRQASGATSLRRPFGL